MSPEQLKASLLIPLRRITSLFTDYPQETRGMALAEGGRAMKFVSANPVSSCDVVESDSEVTTQQANSAQYFIDARNSVLWDKTSGSWTSRNYNGDLPIARPGTLVFSPWSNKVFYCDEFMRLTPVNLSEDPVPS